jgi:VanZ family protein
VDVTRTRARILTQVATWAPPLVLMAVIYWLSDQPDLSTGLGVWDFIGRKLVHMTEYALLCFLWWRALRTVVNARAAVVLAFCVSLAYSATDELHQRSVQGRHGTPVDVAIDAVGMGAAALVIGRRTW